MVFVGSQQKPDGWRTRRQKEDGELGEKIGMKKHLMVKIVGRTLQLAGHIQRMSEQRLRKRTWETEECGRRR